MAGGFKNFGPTYNTTGLVRLGYEGLINGTHEIDATDVEVTKGELAGKFAAVGPKGIKLAELGGAGAVGLFREDLNDMVNASLKASFYFRGGEYYVSVARTAFVDADPNVEGTQISVLAVGDEITTDAVGRIKKLATGERALGVVTHIGEYGAGNMYANAGLVANGDTFIGFIMYV